MITDPLFYLLAIPALLIVGIAKGGMGGGIGILGVPLMALAIGPVQAAAIMLPILMVIMWIWQQRGMPKPADEQAARMQKRVVLLSFNDHVGGMTSGGLTATDTGESSQPMRPQYPTRSARSRGLICCPDCLSCWMQP